MLPSSKTISSTFYRISKCVVDHRAAFTRLKKNLDEACSDRLALQQSYGTLERSLRRRDQQSHALRQHLNDLRIGTSLQYDLEKVHPDGKVAIPGVPRMPRPSLTYLRQGRSRKGNADGRILSLITLICKVTCESFSHQFFKPCCHLSVKYFKNEHLVSLMILRMS